MSRSPPPDRGNISTEQRHPASRALETLDLRAAIGLFIEDHRIVPDAVAETVEVLAQFIVDTSNRMRSGGRLIYLGAGTSGRLGVLDASECPPTFQSDPGQVIGLIAGGDSALRKSSEGKEDDSDGAVDQLNELSLTAADTVLGIAAGGTTPYVLGGLQHARRSGARTALLTCARTGAPPSGCQQVIVVDTGPELLSGSTRLKAGSATKLALNIISTLIFVRLGKVYGNLMVDLRATNDKLTDRAIRILIELSPELSRSAAGMLLESAGGNLKTGIAMQMLGLTQPKAEALLRSKGGNLGSAMREVTDAQEHVAPSS